MDDDTAAVNTDDIAVYRQWRDEWSDQCLRHKVMAADVAFCWEGIDLLLRQVDRCIDPDDLDDEQTAIYEAGYEAGQRAVAVQLRQVARQLDGLRKGGL